MGGIPTTSDELCFLYPFHVAFSHAGDVVSLGRSIGRLWPVLNLQKQELRFLDTDAVPDAETLTNHAMRIVSLRYVNSNAHVTGPLIRTERGYICLGQPETKSLEDFYALGLSQEDFGADHVLVRSAVAWRAKEAQIRLLKKERRKLSAAKQRIAARYVISEIAKTDTFVKSANEICRIVLSALAAQAVSIHRDGEALGSAHSDTTQSGGHVATAPIPTQDATLHVQVANVSAHGGGTATAVIELAQSIGRAFARQNANQRARSRLTSALRQLKTTTNEEKLAHVNTAHQVLAFAKRMNPAISSIGTAVELLQSSDLDTFQRGYLDIVNCSHGHLARNVAGIIDILAIRNDTFRLNEKPTNLVEMLQRDILGFHHDARAQKVNFTYEARALPESVIADEQRLRSILSHMISAGLGFLEKGRLHFRVTYNDNHLLAETIGVGEDESLQETLLSAARHATENQASELQPREVSLLLIRELSQQMKATTDVTFGSPSSFHTKVRFPCKRNDAPQLFAAAKPLKGLKVAYLGDDAQAFASCAAILERAGARLSQVNLGKSKSYDATICETNQTLDNSVWVGATTSDAPLRHPLQDDQLLSEIAEKAAEFRDDPSIVSEVRAAEEFSDVLNRNILVVDHNLEGVVASTYLKALGANVTLLHSSVDAIDSARENKFDAAFVAAEARPMPAANLCESLKRINEKTAIFALVNGHDDAAINELEPLCKSVVLTPFSPEHLKQVLNNRYRGRATEARPPILEFAKLRDVFEEAKEQGRAVLDEFADQLENDGWRHLQLLREAAVSKNEILFLQTCCQLRGVCTRVGAYALSSLVAQLTGQRENKKAMLDEVETLLEESVSLLRQFNH